MFNTSPRTLKLMAALVWHIGFIVLYAKSSALLLEAEKLNPDQLWTWLAVLVGLTLGAVKARYLFSRLCIKNLKRIDVLGELPGQPRIWNFYRGKFFIFLFLMVSLGGYLSRIAHGDYSLLVTVATVDLTIATALLGSSYCFWKELWRLGHHNNS